ncbi:MAG: nucleoside diphosphate kinase regulator [Pseudomonadales bacterium]
MTQNRSVLVGERDHARLTRLIARTDPKVVALLDEELDAATVVPEDELPVDVVAMGSVVTFRDADTGETSTIELVFPAQADASLNRISILAPVGAALIGLRVGERITWPVPNGRDRHLEVTDVRSRAWTEP